MVIEVVAFSLVWFLISVAYLIHGTYTALSIFSIHTRLNRKVWTRPLPAVALPLCLIIPLYKEDGVSVAKTFTSLAKQDYPRNLARIIIVIEEGDDATLETVQDRLYILKETGLKTEVLVKPPPRSTKASAINHALFQVKESIIGVYDGGDVIVDRQQLQRAVALLASGCDGVGVRVIRGGNGVLSVFSWVDTTMWCDVTLPALTYLLQSPLLSGEGLFVKKEAVGILGGFPNSLTEDAHLTLLFAQQGLKMALLDSTIYEGAPPDLNTLIRQKLRWHRGTLLCLSRTLVSKLPIRRKIPLVLAYSGPIVMIAIALSLLTLVVYVLVPRVVPGFFVWWSLFIALTMLTAPVYLSLAKYQVSLMPTLLLPLYWFIVGLLTLYSLFSPGIPWYRTLRRADFNPPFPRQEPLSEDGLRT